jgi:hypothetical protein
VSTDAKLQGPEVMQCRCATVVHVWTAAGVPVKVEDQHGHKHLCPTVHALYVSPNTATPHEESSE